MRYHRIRATHLNYRLLRCALPANARVAGRGVNLVLPQTWQKCFGVVSAGIPVVCIQMLEQAPDRG